MATRYLLSLCVLLLALRPDAALARCAGPLAELTGSYPSDGMVDVPTNADLFLFGPVQQVFLSDGTELPPSDSEGARHYDLGLLAPSTRYQLRIVLHGRDPAAPTIYTGGAIDIETQLSFTTGAGPGDEQAPAPPQVAHVEASRIPALPRDEPGLCKSLVQACYDTGPNTLLALDVTPAADTLFLRVESAQGGREPLYFENGCLQPWLFAQAGGAGTPCLRVRAISRTGASSEPAAYCAPAADAGSPAADTELPAADHDGCSTSLSQTSHMNWCWLLACAALLIRRRRTR